MSLYKLNQKFLWLLAVTILLIVSPGQLLADDDHDNDDGDNIVAAIVSAPVLSSGILADEPTEFNLILLTDTGWRSYGD